MKLYLAGPMRGYDQYNFPAFIEAAARPRAEGHEVWSPAERDMEEDGFDPARDKHKSMAHYMEHDLPAVCRADAVALLPGWEKSHGACLEVVVAYSIGKDLYAATGPVCWLDQLHTFRTALDTVRLRS
jgi:hypothetical protein